MRNDREYIAVHISIDTGYQWGEGLERSKIDAFDEEITGLLKANGWNVNVPNGWTCPEASRGHERLYIHPMEITGDVLPETVCELKNVVSSMQTARLLGTSNNYTVKEWDDDGYREWLEENRGKVREEVLKACKTKRKNLFVIKAWPLYELVGKKFSVPRVGHSHIGYCSDDPEFCFAKNVVEELVDSGELETTERNGRTYVRTA